MKESCVASETVVLLYYLTGVKIPIYNFFMSFGEFTSFFFFYFQMHTLLFILQILMYLLVPTSKMSQINGSVLTAHLQTIQLLMYAKCASYLNLLLAGHHFYVLHLVHVIVIQKKILYQYRVDILFLK